MFQCSCSDAHHSETHVIWPRKFVSSPWSNHAYCLEGIWTEPSNTIQSQVLNLKEKSCLSWQLHAKECRAYGDVEDRGQIIVIVRHISGRGREGSGNNKVINPFKDRVILFMHRISIQASAW